MQTMTNSALGTTMQIQMDSTIAAFMKIEMNSTNAPAIIGNADSTSSLDGDTATGTAAADGDMASVVPQMDELPSAKGLSSSPLSCGQSDVMVSLINKDTSVVIMAEGPETSPAQNGPPSPDIITFTDEVSAALPDSAVNDTPSPSNSNKLAAKSKKL